MLGWQLSRLYPARSSRCLFSLKAARLEIELLGDDWEGDRGRGITLLSRRNLSLYPKDGHFEMRKVWSSPEPSPKLDGPYFPLLPTVLLNPLNKVASLFLGK